jgi:hypothetical protein
LIGDLELFAATSDDWIHLLVARCFQVAELDERDAHLGVAVLRIAFELGDVRNFDRAHVAVVSVDARGAGVRDERDVVALGDRLEREEATLRKRGGARE